MNIEDIKSEIKDRYERLKKGKRRPSLEYISTQDLREIFLPYAQNPEEFKKMSNEDIRKLYQSWYEQTVEKETDDEIFTLPDLK